MTEDILERLKATTKINGAYPRDIADAIKELEKLYGEMFALKAQLDLYKPIVDEYGKDS